MASIQTAAATSGGHWYTQTGEQVGQVEGSKKGSWVRPDIRHARKLDLAPGVTTIIGCAHREDLVRWQINQGIMAALTLPRKQGESDPEFVSRVVRDSKEQVEQAADKGTEIHGAVQRFIETGFVTPGHEESVEAAIRALEAVCGSQDWHSEKGVASLYGYGTKADLSSDLWIVDIKTKDGDQAKIDETRLYDSHPMQLAATDHALGKHKRLAGILFLSRTHPRAARFVPAEQEAMDRGMGMFLSLLRYWQIKNQHRPSWATLEA